MVILRSRPSCPRFPLRRHFSSTLPARGVPRPSTCTPFGVAKKIPLPKPEAPSLRSVKPRKQSNHEPKKTSFKKKMPAICLGLEDSRLTTEDKLGSSRQVTKYSQSHATMFTNWSGTTASPVNEHLDYTGRVTIKEPFDTSHKLVDLYDGEVTGVEDLSRVTVNVLKRIGSGPEDPHFNKWTTAVHQRLQREIAIWKEIDGPFVHYIGFATVDGVPAVLTQFIEGVGAKEYLQKMSILDKRFLILGFADALKALHNEQLWHGNLEPQHFVVDTKGKAKLSGFCFNHMIEKELGKVKPSEEHRRSARYAAPEVLEDKATNDKSDVYSFACVALELITGRQPFDSVQQEAAVTQLVIDGTVPFTDEDPEFQKDPWWTIFKSCWSRDPEARPSMKAVYKELAGTSNSLTVKTFFGEYIILSLDRQTLLCTA